MCSRRDVHAKVCSGLIHRLEGGKDFGFHRGGFEACAMAPFLGVLLFRLGGLLLICNSSSFLLDGNLRKYLDKLAKLGALRQSSAHGCIFELENEAVKIAPQPRKVESHGIAGKTLGKSTAP